MDKQTRDYRNNELSKIDMHSTYQASIVISAGGNVSKTKYLSITNNELHLIKKLLTK